MDIVHELFMISNFCHVLNVVWFLLGNNLVSEFYMPTFQNTPFHFQRQVGTYPPMKMEQTDAGELPRRKHTTKPMKFTIPTLSLFERDSAS
jgi:hypothetical protein